MNKKIMQYQLRLFNKLFSTLPAVKKLNPTQNELDLKEKITHIYYFHNKSFWYSKGENENKFVYIFGVKNKPIQEINSSDATLIIDFDKIKQYNNSSLGMFSVKNSEIHIFINTDILNKRYPYFNIADFKITKFESIDKTLKLDVIDLGAINGNLIENLEKLVKQSEILNNEKKQKETNRLETTKENLKPIDVKTIDTEACNICSKKKSDFKIDVKINKLSKIRPTLCGKCIEKIVASEFYDKVKPLINGNDTQALDIAKEKFGNYELFEYGINLLEKYDIIRYIGVKKQFFTIDHNNYLVSKYRKYSNPNDLLIDYIFQKTKKTTKKKKEKIDINKTNLTRETTAKMNLFINALKTGKTHEKAYQISNTNAKKVENWYNFGKKGDLNYIPFYEAYKQYHPETVERLNKMDIFLDTLKKENNIDNALKKSDLTLGRVTAWYSLGEKDHEDYKDFYLACKILLPEGIVKKESKKIVNNDELMNEFITLIEEGKSNNKAINELKIPKFKVRNWINQGKLGNKRYVDFYNAYMREVNKSIEIQKSKELEKKLIKQKEKEEIKTIKEVTNTPELSPKTEKTCKLCGRTLNSKSKNEICRRCARKQYAAKIILKLSKSIKPEISFKKDDLKMLGFETMQIKDYIWTLKEFNLISEENNKLKLKSKEILEKFIVDSGIEVSEITIDEPNVKLNKTCKKCGKTLEISKFAISKENEDGFEDNCKECKKLITTASYLKEILENIEFGSVFTENELTFYYDNPIILQGRLWALLDNNLAKRNFDDNTYILANKEICEEFLNKYYEGTSELSVVNESKNMNHKEHTKKDQMNRVIESISEGKSRRDAAADAGIPLYKITHWYSEGKQGFGKDNIKFYKKLKHLEENNSENLDKLKIKMELVLTEIKNGKTISQVESSNENEIDGWIKKGKQNLKPYDEFLKEFDKLNENIINNDINEYNSKEINRKIFLENYRTGKTKEESAKNADISLSLVYKWYIKGSNDEKPYNEFYRKYIEIKNSYKKPQILHLKNELGPEITVNQMNIILKYLAKGMSEKEAINKANIPINTYKYWLNRGKQEFGELYTQFYKYVNKLNEDNLIGKQTKPVEKDEEEQNSTENQFEDKLEELLIPLDEKYEISFRSSKMNRTGIAWVNIIGKQWVYQKSDKNKPIKFSSPNIYELYQEIKKHDLPWGIRDFSLAKPLISKYFNLDNTNDSSQSIPTIPNITHENIDSGIYAPLPEKYEEAFKSNPMNKSGIAWVNKTGTGSLWRYEKRVDGKLIQFKDSDIYNLYLKVKQEGHIWGIRDYSRAKKIIDIPNEFIIAKTPNMDKSLVIPDVIDPDIYAPLPNKLKSTFNPNQANKTGIAWVNKSGSNWRYSRQIQGQHVEEVDENIYELHKKIKKRNLDWGIKDYRKAREIIKIPDNYIPPNEKEDSIIINNDIYAPLPTTYMKNFNPKQLNKTGIAWVNQGGNKWIYQRNINGVPIKFTATNIKKLHEIVIKNNQIWGIIDFKKAKKIITENKIESKEENNFENEISNNENITINYIQIDVTKTDIIIKGIIKSYELIKVINKFDIFETDIKRIITTSINGNIDLFIELEINNNLLDVFEERIKELGWKIN